MRAAAALLALLASGPVARAATDPCAKYADADAYNYCLAGSGPAAGHRTFTKEPAQTPSRRARPAGDDARPSAFRRLPPGMVQKPAPRGRVRFEIRMR